MKIDKKARNLMVNSVVTEDHPWLYTLLKEKDKVEVDDVPAEYKSDFRYVVPYILKQCGEEWKGNESLLNPVEDRGEERLRCSLCNTPNRYIYYIQNRINGRTMNVGGDCVEEFADIDFMREGKSKGQLLKEAKRTYRRSQLNKAYPGINHKSDRWDDVPNSYSIIIPTEITQDYFEAGHNLRKIIKSYLDESCDSEVYPQIQNILDQECNHIKRFDEYVELNASNIYAVTHRMIQWLKDRKDYQTIDFLMEDGNVNERSITRVWEAEFVGKIRKKLYNSFSEIGFKLLTLNWEERSFDLDTSVANIRLSFSFERFFVNFGVILFDRKPQAAFMPTNIIRLSRFIDSNSYEAAFRKISESLRTSKYGVRWNEDFHTTNQVLVTKKSTDEVKSCSLTDFARETKGFVFDLPKPTVRDYEKFVESLSGQWTSRKEWEAAQSVARDIGRRPNR